VRKKEGDKNKDILDAAIAVFAREGFDKAQITAIAAEAGVGTGSVYLYFRSKDEILDGIFERFWKNLLVELQGLPTAPPRESLRAQLGLLFDCLAGDANLMRIYLRESHRHALRADAIGSRERQTCLDIGETTFQKGAEDGVFRSALPLGLARSFVFGGIRSALAWWLDGLATGLGVRPVENLEACREAALDLAISALLAHGVPTAKNRRGRS